MGTREFPKFQEYTDNMVQITERAIGKVKEIMGSQDPSPSGLRIAVVGGGCSGFSYSMAFENTPNMLDKTYNYDGLKIFVDQASLLYLDGAEGVGHGERRARKLGHRKRGGADQNA